MEGTEDLDNMINDLENQINMMDGGDGDFQMEVIKDENGVDENTLIEEEDIYHDPSCMKSVEALQWEINTYSPKIINPSYKGEDYKDMIDMKKMVLEKQMTTLMGALQNGKLDPKQYLSLLAQSKDKSMNLFKMAKAKNASKTTMERLKSRFKLIVEEHQQVQAHVATLGGDNETEVKISENDGSNDGIANIPRKATTKPKNPQEIQKEVEAVEQRIRMYNAFITWLDHCMPHRKEELKDYLQIVSQAQEAVKGLRDGRITSAKTFLTKLPQIDATIVNGYSPDTRKAKIDVIVDNAKESFELFKHHKVPASEAKSTAKVIKLLGKIREEDFIPIPKIGTNNLEVRNSVFNKNIDSSQLVLTLSKLSGAASHRTFFLKFEITYRKQTLEGETKYHDANRTFNHKEVFSFQNNFRKDIAKTFITITAFKRKYLLHKKKVGVVNIPLSPLMDTLDHSSKISLDYKGKPLFIHFRIQTRKPINSKIQIRTFHVEQIYAKFSLSAVQQMASQPKQHSNLKPQAQSEVNKPSQSSIPQSKPKAQSQPQQQQSSNKPKSGGLTFLSLREKNKFDNFVKQNNGNIPEGITTEDIINYDTPCFCGEYLGQYEKVAESFQYKFIENSDDESADRCRDLCFDAQKKLGSLQRGIEGGQISMDDYKNFVNTEYSKAIKVATWIKKNYSPIFPFMKAKILAIKNEIDQFPA